MKTIPGWLVKHQIKILKQGGTVTMSIFYEKFGDVRSLLQAPTPTPQKYLEQTRFSLDKIFHFRTIE